MNTFEKTIEVRWQDCDANRHVRHSAYYDYGAHNRIRYFSEIGFDSKQMKALNIGPILFKEECTFLKEISLEETIRINLLKGEISPDAGRWILHHEIFNSNNKKCAHITIKGAWMDLIKRKLTVPPEELVSALHQLPEGAYYAYSKKK
jgi:acyl-CoA thioester hydrolase